jgi:hypothetical protein
MLYSSKKNVSKIFDANIMINQRNSICNAYKNEIVTKNLSCTIFFMTDAAFLSWDVDSDNSLFAEISWVRFASFSFEIDRFSRFWLKISNDILSFFFSLKAIFWCSQIFSMIETTSHKFLIRSTWKSFKTKSITKNSKQKRFFFFFFFFNFDDFDARFV